MMAAMKAVRQDVHEEAPDKLMRGKSHEARAPAAAVVPVGECDFIVIDGKKPGIGDGGSMRVASEIGEHVLGVRRKAAWHRRRRSFAAKSARARRKRRARQTEPDRRRRGGRSSTARARTTGSSACRRSIARRRGWRRRPTGGWRRA